MLSLQPWPTAVQAGLLAAPVSRCRKASSQLTPRCASNATVAIVNAHCTQSLSTCQHIVCSVHTLVATVALLAQPLEVALCCPPLHPSFPPECDSRVGSNQAAQLSLQCSQQAPAGVKEALRLVDLQGAALLIVQLLQRGRISYLQGWWVCKDKRGDMW